MSDMESIALLAVALGVGFVVGFAAHSYFYVRSHGSLQSQLKEVEARMNTRAALMESLRRAMIDDHK